MNDFLSGLNKQQQEAVKEIDKPLLIIAGAGSGKTFTVASKIAYLMQTGVKPENILALTFNEKAAVQLQNAVVNITKTTEDIQISTFHSFCNQIIQDNILDTKLNADFRLITDTAQLVFFTKNIDKFGLDHIEFNHDPYTLAGEVKRFISRCKDESISPEDLHGYVASQEKVSKKLSDEEKERLGDLKDILKMYIAYEEYKTKNNMIDFGDMLFTAYKLLSEKPLLLKRYQEKFKYVIVDEFQDTNYIQLQIVNLIARAHKHITVVGDDDQSIYRFRGAYLTNIAEFKKLFQGCVEEPLEQNYRNTKRILGVANAIIENKPERTVKKLFTDKEEGEKVDVIETKDDDDQANFILKTVKELLKKYSMKDIAILCRGRASAGLIVDAFRKHGIPFHFVGEAGFFEEPIVKDVMSYLKVVDDPVESNAEMVRILHRDIYSIRRTDIAKFNTYASDNDLSAFEALEHINKMDIDRKRFEAARSVLEDLIKSKSKMKLLELVHKLLFETDFYRYEIAFDNKKNIALLNKFYKFVEEYDGIYRNSDLDKLVDYLSFASNFEVGEEEMDEHSINVSTVHGVKGGQFPVVIIPNMVEWKFPTKYYMDKFPLPEALIKGVKSGFDGREMHIQEERRLFYVGVTRAEKKLIITYAKRYGDNKTDSKPSRFLEEIAYRKNPNVKFESVEVERTEVEETKIERRVHDMLLREAVSALRLNDYNLAIEKVLLMAKAINEDTDIEKDIIGKIKAPDCSEVLRQIKDGRMVQEKLIMEGSTQTFSVSRINTYKRCPRIYMYRYLMNIPGKPKYFFDFGATVHDVIEQLTRMIMDGRKPSEKDALELLKRRWDPKGYGSKLDEKRDYDEGKDILKTFLKEQTAMKGDIVDIERSFTTDVDGIKMTGRIDRIDKDGEDYTVIDYKTAKKVLSEKEIREDLQLLMYSLVTEKLYGKKPSRIGIWFLRHNKKVFVEVDGASLEAMKADVKAAVEKIMSEAFDPTPGWECKNCDYDCLCDARKM